MTKQEILEALEALKDHTNHEGKQAIDGIKAGVLILQESETSTPAPEGGTPVNPETASEERTEEQPHKFVSGGRFAEKTVEEEHVSEEQAEPEQEDEMKKEKEDGQEEVVEDNDDFVVHNKREKPKAEKPKVKKPSPKKARK